MLPGLQNSKPVVCEQAVYGTFPFWNKGYAVLAQSGGVRQEWLSEFVHLCQSLGQPPSESTPVVTSLVFVKRLESGPWVLCKGTWQGCDDRGRPGAWAFHALFLSGSDYRRTGSQPFLFESHFQTEFSSNLVLDTLSLKISGNSRHSGIPNRLLLKSLRRHRQIRLLKEKPADDDVSQFWDLLPKGISSSRSFTTRAFRWDSDFDFAVVSPSRTPIEEIARTSASFQWVEPDALWQSQSTCPESSHALKRLANTITLKQKLIGLLVLLFPILSMCLYQFSGQSSQESVEVSSKSSSSSLNQGSGESSKPDLALYQKQKQISSVNQMIEEKLTDWCERLGASSNNDQSRLSPYLNAERISKILRYSGPVLTRKIQTNSVNEMSYAKAKLLCLAIDQLINVKPWPEFPYTDRPSPRYSIACLAWVFGFTDMQAETLSLENSQQVRDWFERFRQRLIPDSIISDLVPTGLEQPYPELVEYRFHLNRLSRLASP